MNLQNLITENECSRAQLAAYVDGELLPREEIELEMHLASCKDCAADLNEQKNLLRALYLALEGKKEFELPDNFTEVVIANAQSNVSGLRSSRERHKALFVCLSLVLLLLLGLGGEAETIFTAFIKLTDQCFAVCGFIFHLIYNISIGTAVILRSLGGQFINVLGVAFAFFIVFFCVFLIMLSRIFVRFNRA